MYCSPGALTGLFFQRQLTAPGRDRSLGGASFNLEKAIGTAKYANHAKAERIGRENRFSLRVNVSVHSTPFPSAYLACFAV